MDLSLRPLEWNGVLVVGFDDAIDRLPLLLGRGEALPTQGPPAQDAEPAFNLIEPTRVRWCKVQMDVPVTGQPPIVLRLVRVEIVEDYMQLPARIGRDYLVHEGQEIAPPSPVRVPSHDFTREHLQGCEQRGRKLGARVGRQHCRDVKLCQFVDTGVAGALR